MRKPVKQYDAKLDTKKRITLRGTTYDYYHVIEYDDGCILLEPRELTVPLTVSREPVEEIVGKREGE